MNFIRKDFKNILCGLFSEVKKNVCNLPKNDKFIVHLIVTLLSRFYNFNYILGHCNKFSHNC